MTTPTRFVTPSRIRSVVYWFTTLILLAESAVGGAYWDLFRIPYVKDMFNHLGYPLYFATLMGLWKIAAVLAIIAPGFPRLKEWAYAGVFFVYSGASFSHLAVGDSLGDAVGPGVFALFALASWALRPKGRRDPVPNDSAWILARPAR
ncbi:DoxX family protein [Solihabitans fulvus]|uniref:DoxX family protein n=1 Tax=Solihabitans fulvus TaxID=1892852 RepID=A0A5B2XBB3_9PSEU|nr:DoxX family protein [Solihabitans fulvus]KAA2260998.1 DoxX family protein [Solihabitans fulvus]